MSTQMARLIHSLLDPSSGTQRDWTPPVDIYRLSDGWLMKFDLAGVRATDCEVLVSGRRLTVRGSRRDLLVDELGPCSAYSMEITYSRFERTIELPCDLEAMATRIEFRDGMLLVRLKAEGCAE